MTRIDLIAAIQYYPFCICDSGQKPKTNNPECSILLSQTLSEVNKTMVLLEVSKSEFYVIFSYCSKKQIFSKAFLNKSQ